jgi:hypothetical protein
MQKMMDSLNDLMRSLDDFMTRRMSWFQPPSDEAVNALFVDKAVWVDPVRSEEETVVSRIDETRVVRNTSSLDPETGEKIEGRGTFEVEIARQHIKDIFFGKVRCWPCLE